MFSSSLHFMESLSKAVQQSLNELPSRLRLKSSRQACNTSNFPFAHSLLRKFLSANNAKQKKRRADDTSDSLSCCWRVPRSSAGCRASPPEDVTVAVTSASGVAVPAVPTSVPTTRNFCDRGFVRAWRKNLFVYKPVSRPGTVYGWYSPF